ncbi:hypothetical protein DV26_44740 [Amycolatopsis mediterranei]|nr:hypothetical protein DV26_44740 [Amycolatopsis mediterranei]KDU85410.1 hypothetical protein DV36_46245 [Amycolatopsis mediterranei]
MTTATIIDRGRGRMKEERVGFLVSHIAVLTRRSVTVIVDNDSLVTPKDCHSRENLRLDFQQMRHRRSCVLQDRQRPHLDQQVLGEHPGIESIQCAEAQLPAHLLCAGVSFGLKTSTETHAF